LIAKAKGQFGCESTVEVERNQSLAAIRKDFGNRTVAWANLDHGALANIAQRVHNGMAGSVIYEKVLPKFWFTFHLHPIVSTCSRALL
jgi:hypothetical protein